MSYPHTKRPVALSIGIMACNEARSIEPTLAALLRQSVFERLCAGHERAEILVLANGCTDDTATVAREIFARAARDHQWRDAFTARVIEIAEAGRNNAWNRFVHEFSALDARCLTTLHAGILLHHRDAIHSLMAALERRRQVNAASGRRCEDVLFKEQKTFWERLALTTPPIEVSRGGQLNGELVCLRSAVARKIHLPRGLEGGFDRFVTELVTTDFLRTGADPTRIAFPPDAAHICASHIGPREVVDSHKRRMMGQTAAHVLLHYLVNRPWRERQCLLETLRSHETVDPLWLEKMIAAHVRQRRFFGNLFPGVLRMPRSQLAGLGRLRHIPEACAGFALRLIACLRAHRSLRARPVAAPAVAPEAVLSAPHVRAN